MNGLRTPPLINGVEPAWANLIVNIAGFPEERLVGIDYGESQNIENIYAMGQNPIARGYGNIEPSASITVLRSAVENIRAASPTGKLQDIAPFDIIVQYIPMNAQTGTITTHRLRNCQFTEDKVSLKQGDTKMETSLPLIISHVDWK